MENKIIIKPTSEADWLSLKTLDITSTEISALFGCSPYQTAFELWHRKMSGVVIQLKKNERMFWGTRLEAAIAAGIAEDQGWTIRRMDEYVRQPKLRMGASFDFAISDDGLLEIKNVDSLAYRDGWLVNGDDIEAPPHIELQVQHQLTVSGRAYAYIGALIGGNSLKLIRREPMPEIISAIRQKVAEFWKSIDDNIEPSPTFPQDTEAVIRLTQYAEPGKVIAGTDDLTVKAAEYRRLGDEIKERQELRDTLKAEILLVIGDAEKVKGEEYTISAGITGEADIAYHRAAFRNFKITWRKKNE